MSGARHPNQRRSAEASHAIRQEIAWHKVMQLGCPLSSGDVLAAMLLSLLHIACLRLFACFLGGLGFASRAATDVCLKSLASHYPADSHSPAVLLSPQLLFCVLVKDYSLGPTVLLSLPLLLLLPVQSFCLSSCGGFFARGV